MTKQFLLAISVALMVFCLQGDLHALTYEGSMPSPMRASRSKGPC